MFCRVTIIITTFRINHNPIESWKRVDDALKICHECQLPPVCICFQWKAQECRIFNYIPSTPVPHVFTKWLIRSLMVLHVVMASVINNHNRNPSTSGGVWMQLCLQGFNFNWTSSVDPSAHLWHPFHQLFTHPRSKYPNVDGVGGMSPQMTDTAII